MIRPPALLAALLWLAPVTAGRAQSPAAPMRYIHSAPESVLDQRCIYPWKILEAALERTRPAYGDYVLLTGEVMNESRQVAEMRRATGAPTVMYRGTSDEQERDFLPIRIPVDKDLAGYGVFLIRKEQAAHFAGVATLDALKPFRFGVGLGRMDVRILQASGLTVVTGSTHEGLFDMLNNDRFDVLLRSTAEINDDVEARKMLFPDLMIEPGLILYYPMPMYFWFPRTDEGHRLARRAEEGMRAMIADGTYDRIFAEYNGPKIEALGLTQRRLIRIPNPNLGPETPLADRELWFDPATYPSAQ